MPTQPFQLSLASESLLDVERFELMQLASKAGFDAVELACMTPHLPEGRMRQERTRVKLDLQLAQLQLAGLSLNTTFTQPDRASRSQDALLEVLELAEAYGTSLVRITPGPPTSDQATLQEWDSLVEYLSPCLELAEEKDIRLAVETRFGMLADDLQSTLMFLDHFDSEALGISLDFCTVALNGSELESSIAQLGERIFFTHVKDAIALKSENPPKYVPLGEGIIPYATVIRALLEIGYMGYLSIECPYEQAREETATSMQADVAYLKQLLKCYA